MEKSVFIRKRDAKGKTDAAIAAPPVASAALVPADLAPDFAADDARADDLKVEQAVAWINRKVQATVHFGLIQIGYYLLQTFFDGRIEEALSRNPHKHHSFRKLCQRPDLLISSTHLVSSVKLVVQERQLSHDPAFQTLPVSHKIALLAVKDEGQKRELARRVRSEGLSVRALTREVRAARGQSVPEADAWARRLRRALEVVIDATSEGLPEGISPRETVALDRAIGEARKRLQTTLGAMRGIRSVAV